MTRKSPIPLAALAVCSALAQDPASLGQPRESTPVFSVDVQLVNVAFSVRGPSGSLVSGLQKDDFELYEDGVRQEIRNFSRDLDTPLTLGLIIDRSGSQEGLDGQNLETAAAFLRGILRAQDRALVVGFGNRIKLLHDFTSTPRELELAILEASWNYGKSPGIGPSVMREGGTAVNDAVYWTTKEKLEALPGRKALIMIGDGEENSSKLRVAEVTQELQHADVLLYGLNNGGGPAPHKRHPDVLPYLCEDSGGREFRVGSGPLKDAFDQIEAELRGLYSIGYVSSQPGQPGQFRKIEIKALHPGLIVRSRPGYYTH
jgi:Ca-activated chloride channel family protein